MNKTIIATIISLLVIIGSVMALNSGTVSTQTFETYKTEKDKQDVTLDKRLTRIEEKIDVLVLRGK